ncbi:MAG: phosphate ABC transporter substrate-binding protein, partial [Catenulispora sp.]|nr:phosphate ABC transporter substrate-binding protein [Catenulispora sp.]
MRSPLTARLAALLAAVAVVVLPVAAPVPAHADSYVPIGGDGSSWSQNAMSQWQADVAANKNMTVNYPGNGSSAGRQAYAAGGVDFAVSEIPFGVKDNGSADVPPAGRPLKYLPIVAGGTAFMYHLDSGGRRITNLRLDDTTIVKIFTGNLRFWDDKEIKDENPGIALPHREIVPVVRSDGSGTTAQLTTWFDTQPNLRGTWAAYCQANGRVLEGGRCGTTSFFPVSGNKFLALNGSIGVSGYVASDPGEGAITYVEYSYAQNKKFPVAKVLNKSGYYIAPSALNVAVALTSVTIDKDTLLQHLEGVYNSPD